MVFNIVYYTTVTTLGLHCRQLSEQVSYILKVFIACLGFLVNTIILFRSPKTTGQKPQDNWTQSARSRDSLIWPAQKFPRK
jgi:hypothetical protein